MSVTKLPTNFRLSVVMPVYNETATIVEVIEAVLAESTPKELIIVDDGSTDGTREQLKLVEERGDQRIRVFLHQRNQGKGAAVRTGFTEATGDIVLIQDADLEYDPRDYTALISPILEGKADVVYGSRFAGGGAHRVHLYWHKLGNNFLTMLSNMLTNLNLTDMEVCYKVFRSGVLKSIDLRSNKFDIEPEITAKVARKGFRVFEVPISYAGRDYDEGKKIGWRDGVQALWAIIKYRFWD